MRASHKRFINFSKILKLILSLGLACVFTLSFNSTIAAPNYEINYQGKLTDSTGSAVADGTYNMRFWLLTSPSIATTSAVWTESLTSTNKVQVTNGLFSVMLGSTTPLSSVDFNQTLYLGVEVGGTGSPSWDGEMSPRKILGAVPAAFEAEHAQDADTVGGVASTSFLRSDAADTASGLLTFTGGIISNSSSTITNLTTLTATTTNLVINGERYTDLTGTGLQNSSGVLTLNTTLLDTWYASSTDFDTSSELLAILQDETGTGNAVFSASPTFTGTINASALTLSSTLTLSGSAANIALGSNFLSGDGGDEGIYIDSTGRVGIGTAAPSAALEVVGDIVSRGTSWTQRTPSEAAAWQDVEYGNGTFVAVAYSGTDQVMTSPDGITWTARTEAQANQWRDIVYGNGLFVAVGQSGTNRVMTSPDGITWTARTAAEQNSWMGVAYGNGVFVAISTDGTNQVMTSPDGITWTARSEPQANAWSGITYGNGYFVAVAANGTNRVMRSRDGINWDLESASVVVGWNGVGYGNGLFVAVGGSASLMTSPDGESWTTRTAPAAYGWNTVAYGDGMFVALSSNGTGQIMTSADGVTWVTRTEPVSTGWQGITYGNGRFVAVSTTNGEVMTSGQIEEYQLAHNNIYQGGFSLMSGNLGVGTSTPTHLLSVAGSASVKDAVVFSNGSTQAIAATPEGISWSLNTAAYFQSTTTATQDTNPAGLFFKHDGTKMYVVGVTGQDINEYNLTTAWNVSTASYVQNKSVSTEDTVPYGLFFKPDGTKMYVVGDTGNDINEYSLSTPWNISTATFVQVFSVSGQETNPRGFFFKPDGTKMYVVGLVGQDINEYNLSIPWNISTASFVQVSSVASQDTVPQGISFKGDGTKMYITGNTGDEIDEYNLSTPWDVSTKVFVQVISIASQDTDPRAIFMKPDGTKMFVLGNSSDVVAEYDLGLSVRGSVYTALNANARLGIGTTTANQKLSIFNNGADAAIEFSTISGANEKWTVGIDDSDGAKFKISSSSALGTNDRFVIDGSGRVGIGISSPAQRFVVALGSSEIAQFNDGTNASAIWGQNIGFLSELGEARITTRTTSPLAFFTGGSLNSMGEGTERMRILNTGEVGIGTSTPTQELTVSGDIRVTGRIYDSSNSAGTNGYVLKSTGTGFTWVATSTLGFGTGTVIGSGSTNRVAYWSGASALTSDSTFTFANSLLTAPVFNASGASTTVISVNGNSLLMESTSVQSIALGYNSNGLLGSGNLAIGEYALSAATTSAAEYNVALGITSQQGNVTGDNNVSLGAYTLQYNATGSENVAVGYNAGTQLLTSGNVAVGYEALANAYDFSARNTALGYRAGYGMESGSNNIALGYATGESLQSGSFNILIGNDIELENNAWSNRLNIGNLLFGTGIDGTGTTLSSGNIGIGTSSPSAKLTVAGTGLFTNTLTASYFNASGTSTTLVSLATSPIFQTSENWDSVFLGFDAASGTGIQAQASFFVGENSGNNATNADGSNFLGYSAGDTAINADYANFFGYQSGYQATNATYSNFSGYNAGYSATNASYSNFFGYEAGRDAPGSFYSNFIGESSGYSASNAFYSNFIGVSAGGYSDFANSSNFIGFTAGYQAANAATSTFIGYSAGYSADNASNALFLGSYAGYNDTVNNTLNSGSSIAIGRYAGTGGFSNSIALGRGVINSAATQLNIGNLLYGTGIYNSDTQSASAVSGGKIGIGTSTPNARLSVSDTISADEEIFNLWDNGLKRFSFGEGTYSQQSVFTINQATDNAGAMISFSTNNDPVNAAWSIISFEDEFQIYGNRGAYVPMLKLYNSFSSSTGNENVALLQQTIGGQSGTAGYTGLKVDITESAVGSGNRYLANFLSNSTSRFVIEADGNVGIGTSSPMANLHIRDGSSGVLPSGASGDLIIQDNHNNFEWAGISLIAGNSTGGSYIDFGDGDDANIGGIWYQHDTNAMYFNTNNATALTLSSTGNVGIGTTTPNQKLSIFANGADAAIEFSTISGANEKWTMGIDDSDGAKFKISSSSALGTNDRFVIDGAGNVGIGTASPQGKLDVTNGNIQLSSGYVLQWGDFVNKIYGVNDFGLYLQAGGADRLVIRESGNIGIGTTSPAAKLDVWGADTSASSLALSVFNSAGSQGLGVYNDGQVYARFASINTLTATAWLNVNSDDSSPIFSGYDSGTEVFRITDSGRVGIGTTTPTQVLSVVGTTTISSGLLVGSGEVGSLAYSFNADSNTGIYNPGSNVLSFVTGGADRLYIDNANIGIGTTTPQEPFHWVAASNNDAFRIQNNDAGEYIDFNNDDTDLEMTFVDGSNIFSFGYHDTSDNLIISNTTSLESGQLFSFTQGGNFGIGTTSPYASLTIEDQTPRLTLFDNDNVLSATNPTWGIRATTGGLNIQSSVDNISYTDRLYVGVSGRVGINTISPQGMLHIASTTDAGAEILLNSNDTVAFPSALGSLWFGSQEANGYRGAGIRGFAAADFNTNDYPSYLAFYTTSDSSGTSTQRMILTQDGNLGIGTSTPSGQLQVIGDTYLENLVVQDTGSESHSYITLQANTIADGGENRPLIDMLGANGTGVRLQMPGDSSTYLRIGSYTANKADVGTEFLSINGTGNLVLGTTTILSGNFNDRGILGVSNQDSDVQSGEIVSGLAFISNESSGTGPIPSRDVVAQIAAVAAAQHSGGFWPTDIVFSTLNSSNVLTERMRLLQGGNIGIGTTTPNQKLSIFANAADAAVEFSTVSGANEKWTIGVDDSDGAKFKISSSSALGTNDRLVINGAGYIGIGTSSPTHNLHIAGTSATLADSTEIIRLENTTGHTAGIGFKVSTTYNDYRLYNNFGSLDVYNTDDGRTNFRIDSSGNVHLAGNGADTAPSLTATVGGRVGIGTTSPSALLSLSSSGNTSIRLHSSAASARDYDFYTDGSNIIINGVGGSSGTLLIGENSLSSAVIDLGAPSNSLYLSDSGEIGLGTTTPNQKLSIFANAADAAVEFSTVSGANEKWTLGIDDSDRAKFKISSSSALGTSDRLVIDGAGNVGIGTSTPAAKLDVNGSGYFNGNGTIISLNPAGSVSETNRIAVTGNRAMFGYNGTNANAVVQAGASKGIEFNVNNGTFGSGQAAVITSTGLVGVGTTAPTQKLTVAGNILLSSQAEAAVAWGTSYNGAEESVTALTEFNGYLYAGQGNGTGDGDVFICTPSTAGNATDCDNASDWTTSYNGSQEIIWSFAEFRGKLYAGQGSTLGTPQAGDGDIFVCNPATTGDTAKCDSGDWSTSRDSAALEAVFAMAEFNGRLYAVGGLTTGTDGDIYVCNPDTAGTAGICDNASDWTTAYDGAQEGFASLAVFNGRIYAAQGLASGDGDIYVSSDGSTWAVAYNGAAEYFRGMTVYNGKLYAAQSATAAGSNDVYVTSDGITWSMSYNGSQEWMNAMTVYNGAVYTAQGNSAGDGDIFSMTGSSTWATSYNGSQEEITSFAVYNGKLYAGQGNGTGDGDVLYMNQVATTSYSLKFAAGNSTGDMWFAEESLFGAAGPNGEIGTFKLSHALVTSAGAYDVAEDYPTADKSLLPGDIVSYDPNRTEHLEKATVDKKSLLAGVVSGNPGFLLSSDDRNGMVPTALVGRVPVRVSDENGQIEVGDSITISSEPGVGMKANFGDKSIGYALAPFDVDDSDETILIYVSVHYAFGMNPDPALFASASSTESQLGGQTIIERLAHLASGFVDGVLSTIGINTQQVNTATLCVGTVCVDEATFLNIVEQSGGAVTPDPVVPDPVEPIIEDDVSSTTPEEVIPPEEEVPVEEAPIEPVLEPEIEPEVVVVEPEPEVAVEQQEPSEVTTEEIIEAPAS